VAVADTMEINGLSFCGLDILSVTQLSV